MAKSFAGVACIFGLVLAGCATPHEDDRVEGPSVEVEEDLDLEVNRVEATRGALRMTATMREGSPDVSVQLGEGEGCEEAEVGRGLATRVKIVWTFTSDEFARAMQCGLVVRARNVQDGRTRVHKKSTLGVSPSVWLDEAPEDVTLKSSAIDQNRMSIVVESPARTARLFAGNEVVEGEEVEQEQEQEQTQGDRGRRSAPERVEPLRARRFDVSLEALARAIVSTRPMRLWSRGAEPASLTASVRIGDAELGADEEPIAADTEGD